MTIDRREQQKENQKTSHGIFVSSEKEEDVNNCKPGKMSMTEVIASFVAMKRQEESYTCFNYLTQSRSAPSLIQGGEATAIDADKISCSVDEGCRLKMCTWCYRVVDFYKLNRETVQLSMSHLDRFMCTPTGTPYLLDRAMFQLASVAALCLAIKVREGRELPLSQLCYLSNGSFGVEQIYEMEMKLLRALEWRVQPPTATSFVQYLHALLPQELCPSIRKRIQDVARYEAELSAFSSFFIEYRASTIALSSFLNAIEGCGETCFPDQLSFLSSLEEKTGMTQFTDDVIKCGRKLCIDVASSGMIQEIQMVGCLSRPQHPARSTEKDSSPSSTLVSAENSPAAVGEF